MKNRIPRTVYCRVSLAILCMNGVGLVVSVCGLGYCLVRLAMEALS